jgi:hypothetical protein
MHFSLHDALYFLTGVVFPTYGVLEWVSKHFGKPIKRILIRNEREAALYARYKEQEMGSSSQSRAEQFKALNCPKAPLFQSLLCLHKHDNTEKTRTA